MAMLSRKFWIGAAVFWFGFGLIAGIQVWISMITHGHLVPLLVGHSVMVWMAWFAFTVLIVKLTARYPIVPPKVHNLLIHSLVAIVVGIVHSIYWVTLTLVMRPYDRMNPSWSDIRLAGNFFYRLPAELILYFAVAGAVQAID